jgi:DNA-binding NarL/FixJ family response regulator
MKNVKIILIDDHEVVRKGLRSLLESEPNLEVVAEAHDGISAIENITKFEPDVAIMDLQLPKMNGIEVTRQICRIMPKIKVIVFTFYGNETYVLSAFHAGAKSYVVKDAPLEELLRAIKEVMSGHRYLGSPLPELAIDAYLNIDKAASRDPYDLLTRREKEVLQLVAEGHTNVKIADRLYISRRTVEIHRSNMMRKLGLHKPQVDLVQYAVQRGLIKPLYHQSSVAAGNEITKNLADSIDSSESHSSNDAVRSVIQVGSSSYPSELLT